MRFLYHCLFPALSLELGGKTVSIQVEVVDAPLVQNILLGRNWFYTMTAVSSTVFINLQFPHMGKIVTIGQLDYCTLDVTTPTVNNIPMLGQYPPPSVNWGMYVERIHPYGCVSVSPSQYRSGDSKYDFHNWL